jgi:MFS family permease
MTARWSDVYIAAVARALSNCGDMLAATALALVLVSRGQSGLAVAGILLAVAVPPVVIGPFAGRLADRVDSRTLVVTVGLIQVAICVALAYATSPAVIIGLMAALAVGFSIVSPTMSALTPLMVGRENLARAGGIGQTASTVGMLAAPALGGVLVGAFGARVPLLIDAATYLALPAAGLLIRTRRGGRFRPPADPTATSPVAGSPTYRIRRDGLLFPVFLMVGAVVAAISAVNVVDVFFVRQTLHSSSTVYGLIGAVWLAGMVLGAMIWSRQNRDDAGTAQALLISTIVTSIVIAVAGLVPGVAWLVPLWLVGGALNGIENVTCGVLLGSRVPPAVRGHAGAMFNSVASGANAFGYLIGGLLLAVASPRVLIVGCGVAGLVAVVLFGSPLVRALRRESPAIAEPTALSAASVDSVTVASTP